MSDPFAVIATTGPGVTTYVDMAVADPGPTAIESGRSIRSRTPTLVPRLWHHGAGRPHLRPQHQPGRVHVGDHFQLDVNFAQLGAASSSTFTWAVFYRHLRILCPAVRKGIPSSTYLTHRRDSEAWLPPACRTTRGRRRAPVRQHLGRMLPSLMGRNFFSFDWPSATPGDYTIFMTVTQAGTASVIAQGTVTVSYFP